MTLLLHGLIDRVTDEPRCKDSRRDSDLFHNAHFMPLLYFVRKFVVIADMALYAIAVPAPVAIHPIA